MVFRKLIIRMTGFDESESTLTTRSSHAGRIVVEIASLPKPAKGTNGISRFRPVLPYALLKDVHRDIPNIKPARIAGVRIRRVPIEIMEIVLSHGQISTNR